MMNSVIESVKEILLVILGIVISGTCIWGSYQFTITLIDSRIERAFEARDQDRSK